MIYDDFKLNDIEGWFTPEEAEWLYEQAKQAYMVLEIGCFFGRSTCALLAGLAAHPPREVQGLLTVVDTFDGRGTVREEEIKRMGVHAAELKFRTNLTNRNLPARRTVLFVVRGTVANLGAGRGYDFAFIDGAHDGASVTADINGVVPRMLPGGIVAGHDYESDRPGLQEAVRVFCGGEPQRGAGSIWWRRV